MKKPTVNWKQKYQEADRDLHNCRRGCKEIKFKLSGATLEAQDWKHQWQSLCDRGPVLVHETVVPFWARLGCFAAALLLCLLWMAIAQMKAITAPVPRPYVVYRDIATPAEPLASYDGVIAIVKRASVAIEHSHYAKADELLHEAVVELSR